MKDIKGMESAVRAFSILEEFKTNMGELPSIEWGIHSTEGAITINASTIISTMKRFQCSGAKAVKHHSFWIKTLLF